MTKGETVGVEILLPSDATVADLSLEVAGISHIRHLATDRHRAMDEHVCPSVDAMCSRAYLCERDAALRLTFTDTVGNSYACSATAVNDGRTREKKLAAPSVLTSHDCLSDAYDAETVTAVWNQRTTVCGGETLTSQYRELNGGADLLASHRESNHTLLRLRDPVPTETTHCLAGWSTAADVVNATTSAIHHGATGFKEWAQGKVTEKADFTLDGQVVTGYKIDVAEGVLSTGSAGAGWFADDADGGRGYIGVQSSVSGVFGGDCGVASVGSFAAFFDAAGGRHLGEAVERDDHGDTPATATAVDVAASGTATVNGVVGSADDVDAFGITVASAGVLTAFTRGDVDTVGRLTTGGGKEVARNDDGGAARNFRLVADVEPGAYVVEVRGFEEATGDYTLVVTFAAHAVPDKLTYSVRFSWRPAMRVAKASSASSTTARGPARTEGRSRGWERRMAPFVPFRPRHHRAGVRAHRRWFRDKHARTGAAHRPDSRRGLLQSGQQPQPAKLASTDESPRSRSRRGNRGPGRCGRVGRVARDGRAPRRGGQAALRASSRIRRPGIQRSIGRRSGQVATHGVGERIDRGREPPGDPDGPPGQPVHGRLQASAKGFRRGVRRAGPDGDGRRGRCDGGGGAQPAPRSPRRRGHQWRNPWDRRRDRGSGRHAAGRRHTSSNHPGRHRRRGRRVGLRRSRVGAARRPHRRRQRRSRPGPRRTPSRRQCLGELPGGYWIDHIRAESAWAALVGITLHDSTVGIVDTGIAGSQTVVDRKRLRRFNASGLPAGGYFGTSAHGMWVAGFAVGEHAGRQRGVNQHSDVVLVDVERRGIVYESAVLSGIETAIDNGAKVVNVSFGDGAECADSRTVRLASRERWRRVATNVLDYARKRDVLVVFSAGSDCEKGDDRRLPPAVPASQAHAWQSHALVVGASTDQRADACFSRMGDVVDLLAPGRGVAFGPARPPLDGTSYAAPLVTGTAGLVRAIDHTLSAVETRALLLRSGSESVKHQTGAANETGCADRYPAGATADNRPGAASTPKELLNLGVAVDSGIVAASVPLTNASTVTLRRGQRIAVPVEVHVPSTSVAAADIVFLVDRTGSFEDDIETLNSNADAILKDLGGRGIDARFGVAGFADYAATGGQAVFTLHQDITSSVSETKSAFGELTTSSLQGGDAPEAQYEALSRATREFSWRVGALRVILLATDAPFHDSDKEADYPGAGREETLALLQREDVVVVGLLSGDDAGALAQLRELALATGGNVRELDMSSSQIAKAVDDGLDEVLGSVDVQLEVLADHPWVSGVTPFSRRGVSPGTTVTFAVHLEGQLDSAVDPITHDIYAWAWGDGSALVGRTRIPVVVPGEPSWRLLRAP